MDSEWNVGHNTYSNSIRENSTKGKVEIVKCTRCSHFEHREGLTMLNVFLSLDFGRRLGLHIFLYPLVHEFREDVLVCVCVCVWLLSILSWLLFNNWMAHNGFPVVITFWNSVDFYIPVLSMEVRAPSAHQRYPLPLVQLLLSGKCARNAGDCMLQNSYEYSVLGKRTRKTWCENAPKMKGKFPFITAFKF